MKLGIGEVGKTDRFSISPAHVRSHPQIRPFEVDAFITKAAQSAHPFAIVDRQRDHRSGGYSARI